MTKEYWITNDRFKLIVIILVVMWIVLLSFFYFKAEEVTKDPCSVCARRMGGDVSCTLTSNGKTKIFNQDYSIDLVIPNSTLIP